jgi:ectoine hydroxylase-related dioxygenase (phytanoyl-CoA dioxygenase family)
LIAFDKSDLSAFLDDGVHVSRWRLTDRHVEALVKQLPRLGSRTDAVAFEADGQTPRAYHGGFERIELYDQLTRLDVLMAPARQILDDHVYVYQFKVNLKAAFAGDYWPWHQDYSFWAKEDGMPSPRALTVGIFLDEVTEFNGPLFFIPGSHRSGCHDAGEGRRGAPAPDEWQQHVAASLSYQTDRDKVAALAARRGMVAPKGRRGTVLFFDSNIVHASPQNISPSERRMLFVTYNAVSNAPRQTRRPAFLVNRKVVPLAPLDSAHLVEPATA